MHHSQDYLRKIGAEFGLPGEFEFAEPYGTGHINDTYHSCRIADGTRRHYIHQRINHSIFKNPPRLMDNIRRVTEHLHAKIARRAGTQPDREALTIIPHQSSSLPFYQDGDGNFWRTYLFITQARTYDICPNPAMAREAARAFARFQADLADLPGGRLYETIPWFHHTPRRFQTLESAIQADQHNRAIGVRADIDFCLARKSITGVVTALQEKGVMPERITHNDTKFNNVMIDDATGQGICVIDLDTVMSGCVLYDFGDMVRTSACSCAEDEPDPRRVTMDMNMFEAIAAGYLEVGRSFLAPVEIEHLAFSGQLITFTIGLRFLTDYLQGDVYFKTHRPGQNLDRARVQFKMVENIEKDFDRMCQIVQEHR